MQPLLNRALDWAKLNLWPLLAGLVLVALLATIGGMSCAIERHKKDAAEAHKGAQEAWDASKASEGKAATQKALADALAAKNSALSDEVRKRKVALPPIPARAVTAPTDLLELRAGLVDAGLSPSLQVLPEAPAILGKQDATKVFDWMGAWKRVPGLEARIAADAKFQEAQDALTGGLTKEVGALRDTVATQGQALDQRGKAFELEKQRGDHLDRALVLAERKGTVKIIVAVPLSIWAGWELHKALKR